MTTFNTPNPISATLAIVAGDVRISTGDDDTTTVSVEPTDASNAEDRKAAEQTRVEYADGRLLVRQPKLRSYLPRNTGGSIDVTVALPARSHINANSGLADFNVDGPLGEAQFKTGIGAIQLGEVATLKARAGIGDVIVEHVTGDADVTTASGEVRLRAVDGGAVIKNSTATRGSAPSRATCACGPRTGTSTSKPPSPASWRSPPTAMSGSARRSGAR